MRRIAPSSQYGPTQLYADGRTIAEITAAAGLTHSSVEAPDSGFKALQVIVTPDAHQGITAAGKQRTGRTYASRVSGWRRSGSRPLGQWHAIR